MKTLSYLDRMIRVRDRAAKQVGKFKLPSSKKLAIRSRVSRGYEYLVIDPPPRIVHLTPQLEGVSRLQNVQLIAVDWQVQGVSRKYSEEQLFGAGFEYVIDPVFSFGEFQSGTICQLVGYTENTLTWELSLKEKVGENMIL